ncbi:hypothetical protein FIE12Z_4251 [Fusarium flagelliforme]|uniref:Uncharacterized protein n=1 Tax=Fusarium flagelliforme TaxID=2675880 RepID=A0A395MV67_9HYPO|nr:hypothetical protein FIE12Z_4251 [Fusarium flagelliforme]
MLTVKQPSTYGYKSVHDLPTPPSTCRLSPPLTYQDSATKPLPTAYRGHSPPVQPMSAPHRGLPPPAAMALPPQPPTAAGAPPPPIHHQPHPPPPPPPSQPSLGPPVHQQRDSWGQLPAPPQQWQGAEEAMKHWLQARAEEDRRKQEEERRRQEEERTRQESLRLEQRKVEMEMLRTSLQSGIPPPMVPLVFAGMGGGIAPQAALEWAQQFMPPGQAPRAQIMPAQWPVSPEHQRESQSQQHAQQQGIPPAPAGYAYPPSPSSRPRGQTVSGVIGRPMGIPHMLALRCIHICNKVNSSKNRKRVLRYTFTTGNHPLRKVVVPRTDPEVLLGKLPESAKPPGMPLPQHAVNNAIDHLLIIKAAHRMRRSMGQDEVILGKEVICHPLELPGLGVLDGRVSAGPYVEDPQYEGRQYEGRQYAVQHRCHGRNDQATNVASRNSQCQQCYQRNPNPLHGIMGLVVQSMMVDRDIAKLLQRIRKRAWI